MERELIQSFDGTSIYTIKDLIEEPKAIVVIVHGLAEHCRRYDYLVERLNEDNISVYRFDNRAHGKSGGKKGDNNSLHNFIDDANEVVKIALKENVGKPIYMLGHSMGGLITVAYGAKYPNILNGQITSGAAVDYLPIFENLKDVDLDEEGEDLVPNGLSDLICRDINVVEDYDKDPLVLKDTTKRLLKTTFIDGVKWLHENIKKYNYPCLILHGEDDRIVPKECSEWLYININVRDKRIKLYKDCFHEILNEKVERDEIIEDIINWIEKHS